VGTIQILSNKNRFRSIARKSRSEVEAIQQENIRHMLSYAVSYSAFYRDLYRGRGVDELLKDGFESIPITDKQMIMSNFNSVVTYPELDLKSLERFIVSKPLGERYKGKFTVTHTSGTSGRMGVFVIDPEGWDAIKGLLISRATSLKLSIPRPRVSYIGILGGHYAGATYFAEAPRLLVTKVECSVNDPIDRIVENLNRHPPDYLNGYCSMLSVLAQEQLAGRLKIKPRVINSGGEAMDNRTRRLIEEAFGQRPYDFYSSTEHLCMARECHLHNGLHVFNDQCVLEVVDDQGRPVEPGKAGQVVITNLYNKCQPLIRYRMNDLATYSEEECDCGSPFPILKSMNGRYEDSILVENGRGSYEPLHPSVFVEFFVPGLRGLQAHQMERNRIKLLIIAGGNKEEVVAAVSKRMREILVSRRLLDVVEFEVELVDSIQSDNRSGKVRAVISHCGPPQRL
jgi:phenylacetate-CoA ligase